MKQTDMKIERDGKDYVVSMEQAEERFKRLFERTKQPKQKQ